MGIHRAWSGQQELDPGPDPTQSDQPEPDFVHP